MEAGFRELALLLDPIPPVEFFSEYWDRQPLVIKSKDRRRYERLITARTLEELISYSDLRFPAIKLARDGRFFSPESFTSDVQIGMCTFAAAADPRKISELYGAGASITFPALHRSSRPVNELCARLEDSIDHPVHANAYLTPGRSRGFAPHYDCHDVLVLQIGGSKRWLIDEPMIAFPHSSQVFNPERFTPGPRLMEIELDAGDLLYLPRGLVHSTVTSRSYSAHLTIGINICSWVDCLAGRLEGAVDLPELRRALPPGFAGNASLRAPLVQKLDQLLAETPLRKKAAGIFDHFAAHVRASRFRIPPFRAETTVISLDSELRAPPREQYLLTQRQDHTSLSFKEASYGFADSMVSTLRAMCERPSFRLRELPQALDEQRLLKFARFLVGIGFLQEVL